MENTGKINNDEILLLAELRNGCKKAFERLYRLYKGRVFRTIKHQINDDAIAEELMQDVFIKVWQKKEDLDLDKAFYAYLFRIAKSRVIDFCRKSHRERLTMNSMQLLASEMSEEPMESDLSRDESAYLKKAIDTLSPQRKKIFMMCKLEGKSYEEVSKMFNISTSTISDHIVKATKIIKKQLLKTNVFGCFLFIPTLYKSVRELLEKII